MICLVWEWGNFGTLSLDFLCWPTTEILGKTKSCKKLPGMFGFWIGFGLALSILHSQALRARSAAELAKGQTPDSAGSPHRMGQLRKKLMEQECDDHSFPAPHTCV